MILLAGCILGFLHAAAASPSGSPYAASVVRLVVTYQAWDEDRPWAKRKPEVRIAQALVLDGSRLLTTADIVADATLIRVDVLGKATRALPVVTFVDRDVNLAILSVDDPEFWRALRPAELAAAAPVAGTVRTVRWRDGQIESSATRIKRVIVDSVGGAKFEFPILAAQTDIDGGGWAEPAFADDGLIGITYSQSDQQVRIIPVEIVARFLERAASGRAAPAFPVLGFKWQGSFDPALAGWLGFDGAPRGVMIRQVPWGTSACGVVRPRDVLLSIDGRDIDTSGNYERPGVGNLRFTAVIAPRWAGEEIPLQVMRDGKIIDLRMTLSGFPREGDLVPFQREGPPAYLVAGGLVLRELDVPYLRTWGKDWLRKAPSRLTNLYYYRQEGQSANRRRIVILKNVLPSEYNIGYHDLSDEIVESVNGRPANGIAAVADAFRTPVDGYHVIVLARGAAVREVVLDASRMEASTRDALATYGIPEGVRLADAPPRLADGDCPAEGGLTPSSGSP